MMHMSIAQKFCRKPRLASPTSKPKSLGFRLNSGGYYRVDAVLRLTESSSADVDAEKIVKKHIKLLHRYNEAKDATQVRHKWTSFSTHILTVFIRY